MGIIFTLDHCQSIAERKKTQTRRIVVAGKPCHYRAGNEYAVTPGRGKYTAYKLIRTGELVFPSDYRDWWRTHHNAAFCPVRVRVTDVRQEPLTAISEADARAEGYASIAEYAAAWDAINGKKRGCRWADNPSVWVIAFE